MNMYRTAFLHYIVEAEGLLVTALDIIHLFSDFSVVSKTFPAEVNIR